MKKRPINAKDVAKMTPFEAQWLLSDYYRRPMFAMAPAYLAVRRVYG